jgi:hypothetical protein
MTPPTMGPVLLLDPPFGVVLLVLGAVFEEVLDEDRAGLVLAGTVPVVPLFPGVGVDD